MEYYVSDREGTGLETCHGWAFHAPGHRRMMRDGALLLYWGFLWEGDLEEQLDAGPSGIGRANGQFQVIEIRPERVVVYADWQMSSEILYRRGEATEVSNRYYLFALAEQDIHTRNLRTVLTDPHEFNGVFDILVPGETMFWGVRRVPHRHDLVVERDRVTERPTFHLDEHIRALYRRRSLGHLDAAGLAQYLDELVSANAATVRREFDDIEVSVSDGIDSLLSLAAFDRAPGVAAKMYNYDHGAGWDHREEIQRRLTAEIGTAYPISHRHFPRADLLADQRWMNHPNVCDFNFFPTVCDIRERGRRPDVLIYGGCGDEAFLHRFNYYARMRLSQDPALAAEDLARETEGRYAHPRDSVYGWQYEFYDLDPYRVRRDAWPESILAESGLSRAQDSASLNQRPRPYTSDMQHLLNMPVVSLYGDLRIFTILYEVSDELAFYSALDAGPQKDVLSRHEPRWRELMAPSKDAMISNTHEFRGHQLGWALEHCLREWLAPRPAG